MTVRNYAHLSEVNEDLAKLIPGVNKAFETIWTYETIEEFRGNWTKTRGSYPDYVPSDGFDVRHEMIPVSDEAEVELRIYRPKESGKEILPLLFVLHGGGFVVGSHDTENAMCRCICVKNRMAIISVNYRRAPEHIFPTALHDGYDAYRWVVDHASSLAIDKEIIILGGMSCGANLIAGLALKLRDEDRLHGVVGQIPNIPATCHPNFLPRQKYELNSYEQNYNSPTINGKHMRWFWDQYYPDATPDPLASPLLAKSHIGLPPTLIQVAGLDPLRDEGFAYADALKQAEVDTTLEVYPGLPHGFVLAVNMSFVTHYYTTMVNWVASKLPPRDGRVVVFTKPGIPLEIRQEPCFSPAAREALVRVRMAGVCGSDAHRLAGDIAAPTVPICFGHEGVGVVVALGRDMKTDCAGTRLSVGDRVYWAPSTPCGSCDACKLSTPISCKDLNWPVPAGKPNAAAFREFATISDRCIMYRIPEGTSSESVITFGCAMPTALRGFGKLGKLSSGIDVVIQGSGPVGLASTLLASLSGALNVIVIGDPPSRLDVARSLGATETMSISSTTVEERRQRILDITSNRGASLAVEAAGKPAAFPEGYDLLGMNGRYLILGLYSGYARATVDPIRINNMNLQIIGSLGIEKENYLGTIQVATNHGVRLRFADLITHRFPLEQIEEAIASVASGDSVKTVIVP